MKRRSSRDCSFVAALSGIAFAASCSRLTEVDWNAIPIGDPSSSGGIDDGAGTGGGGAEDAVGGAGAGGEAGVGGDANGGMGISGSGGSTAGSGGAAGMAGSGGIGGLGGLGGTAGGGTAGTGGSSGSAGTGGTGGPAPCTGTPSPVGDAVVLFDGGPGKPDTPRGGRAGLDAACEAARLKLNLTQTKTHAFITVSQTDAIATLNQTFPDLPVNARVVGPTGIQLATSYSDLIDGRIEQSLVCAEVVPVAVKTWLSGNKFSCVLDGGVYVCGQWDSPNDTCAGWTLGDYHPETQARYGRTTSVGESWLSAAVANQPFLKVACNAATDNLLCLAYTP